MPTRLAIALALAAVLLAAAAPGAAGQAPAGRAFTIAGGDELGYGPGARLKGWREDGRKRLCLRLTIPFAFYPNDDTRPSEFGVNRRLTCVPYPPRRALSWRLAAFNECYVGGRVLMGLVRSGVARVEVAIDAEPPVAARLVRLPRLAGDGALVHAPLGGFNEIRSYDSAGRLLAATSWGSPYPSCPSFGGVEFL